MSEFRLILPGLPHGLRQLLEREAVRLPFTLRVALEVDSLGQILAFVASGRGHAILPRSVARNYPGASDLSVRRISGGNLRRSLSLVRNPAQILTHASLLVEDLTARIVLDLIESGAWVAEPPKGTRQAKEQV